jgi:streptogrisin C
MSAPVRLLAARAGANALVGGTAITTTGTRCSDGFSARRGTTTYLLTAGHCTAEGTTWSGSDRQRIGTVVRTEYPGEDFGIVQVTETAAWRGSGRVQGGPTVTGDTTAPIGSQVCRSGSTSGYHCGVVTATDVTVNYGSGTVISGLTQTTVCAEPGDSGGPFVSGSQAQGVTSGGSGDCTSGGTTYYQPVNPALSAFGLTLTTDTAAEAPGTAPEPQSGTWAAGTVYDVGAEVTYGGVTYVCLQTHQAQGAWQPATTPALWQKV